MKCQNNLLLYIFINVFLILILLTHNFFSFPGAEYFEELQALFHIDPYLLRLFILKTDINNLSSLFERIPLSIVIMRLAKECYYNIKVRSI